MFIALKQLNVEGKPRHPGCAVPEAATWPTIKNKFRYNKLRNMTEREVRVWLACGKSVEAFGSVKDADWPTVEVKKPPAFVDEDDTDTKGSEPPPAEPVETEQPKPSKRGILGRKTKSKSKRSRQSKR